MALLERLRNLCKIIKFKSSHADGFHDGLQVCPYLCIFADGQWHEKPGYEIKIDANQNVYVKTRNRWELAPWIERIEFIAADKPSR